MKLVLEKRSKIRKGYRWTYRQTAYDRQVIRKALVDDVNYGLIAPTFQVTVQNTAKLEVGFSLIIMHHVRNVRKAGIDQMRRLSVSLLYFLFFTNTIEKKLIKLMYS